MSSLFLALLYVGRLCHIVYLSRSWIVVVSQLFWFGLVGCATIDDNVTTEIALAYMHTYSCPSRLFLYPVLSQQHADELVNCY